MSPSRSSRRMIVAALLTIACTVCTAHAQSAATNAAMTLPTTQPATAPDESQVIRRSVAKTDVGTLADSHPPQDSVDREIPWYRGGIVSLALVLAAIFGVTLLFRRFVTPTQSAGAEILRVLCRTSLSPKQSIALVRLGGRFVFVGVTPDNVTTLRVVEDPDEAATLRTELRLRERKTRGPAFDEILTTESETCSDHLESELPAVPDRAQRLTDARENVRGLVSKLKSRSTQVGSRAPSPSGRTEGANRK